MDHNERLSLRYAYNDLIKNKGVNAALTVVLILSAFLMATGAMVMERTVGSVDALFDEAKPPHFLQMHAGDYDPDALARFASKHPEINAWLIEEMIGFDSTAIAWHRPSTGESGDISDSLIDNLFVTQNTEFDFLIDETGAIPRPSSGEVYVPVAYQQRYGLRAGDEIRVRTDSGIHTLRVQGFVRDAQMASSLSAGTRFLVSDADFQELEEAGGGTPEIIAEYRLADPALSSGFQSAYDADAALPKNGEAVTWRLVRLINMLSDGLVAVALMFVSLLLIAIAFLNLRFVIRGTLEDDVREIGAMKAVGVPGKAIARLYLTKYRVLTFVACVVGGVLAVFATSQLTRGAQVNYAEAPLGAAAVVVPVLALVLVYLFVIARCHGVLRRVRKIQVVNAMVHGSTLDDRQAARQGRRQARQVRRTSLVSSRGGSVSRRLAWLDLRAERGQWVLIPAVLALATVLVTLPANLLSTFSSPRIVTYMGAPDSDLRADLRFFDDVDSVREDLLASMRGDDRLTDVRAFANVLYETRGPEGWETLRVDVGDYSGRTIEYLEGERPGPGQIALSVMNADKYQVATGDELTIRRDGETARAVVSGLYQDVTSGGDTAKMQGEVTAGAAGYAIYADVAGGTDVATVAADYGERFPTAAVTPMPEYVQQTFSYLTDAFRSAAVLSLLFGVSVVALVTSLFLKLQLARERTRMGVLSAIGFATGEIIGQVRAKILLAVAAGVLLGAVFAATAGEFLVGIAFSLLGLGLTNLGFIPEPLLVYVAYPLLLTAAGYLGAVVLTARLRRVDKSTLLRA